MHIGFLTPEYPHSSSTPSGGLGTSINNLAASLIRNHVKVSIFIYGQQRNLELEENGIKLHFIEQKYYKVLGWYRYRKFLQTYINKRVKQEAVDLVEAPDWTGITAFINLSCPVIIRMNGSDAYFCKLENRKQKFKNRFFEKLALKSADGLISVSTFTAEKTKEIFNLDRKITVIPNSVEVTDFMPVHKIDQKKTVLYFGTLIRKKGVLELAEIFNIIIEKEPDVEFFLIGKDVVDIFENRSTLDLFKMRLNTKAARQTTYLQEVSYKKIKAFIADAGVIVLPSFAEALPMTWLEAMAMEKALVTSNIGWASDVMDDEITGFTVDPRDHVCFANKVLWLLAHPEKNKLMGKAARKKVEVEFASGVIAKKNIDFYRSQLKISNARI